MLRAFLNVCCTFLAILMIIPALGCGGGGGGGSQSTNTPPPPPTTTTWTLVPAGSDDFTGAAGTAPDPSKWGYDLGAGGWGNNELECYTNSVSNAYQDGNGNLVIEAKSTPGATCPSDNKIVNYTSARLLTKGKFSQTYGRIEARIQLPYGQGIWPAFWMLGANIDTVPWPGCGEMDIMESVTSLGRGTVQSTIHGTGYNGANGINGKYTLPNGQTIDGSSHVYGVIWGPNQIKYYVDDPNNPFVTLTPANMPAGGTWAFNNHPFFIILNVAVGGGWPGNPDSTTFANPQKMIVDYVRVYTGN